jgi:hypothetical protein
LPNGRDLFSLPSPWPEAFTSTCPINTFATLFYSPSSTGALLSN